MTQIVVQQYPLGGQVQQRGMSGERAANVNVGGASEAVAGGLGNAAKAADAAQQVVAAHQDQLDEAAARDIDTQLAAAHRVALYGDPATGQKGWAQLEGADALNAKAATEATLKKARDDAIARADGHPQRQEMVRRVADGRTETALNSMATMSADKLKQYQDTTRAGALDGAINDSVATAGMPEQALHMATVDAYVKESVIAEIGDNPNDPRWRATVEDAQLKAHSKIHNDVLASMVSHDPVAAQAYFDLHANDMDANTRGAWHQRLGAETNLAAGTSAGIGVFAQAYDPNTGVMDYAKAAANIDELPIQQRAAAQAAFDKHDEARKKGHEELVNGAVMQARARIARGEDPRALPADLALVLGQEGKMDDIFAYAKQYREGMQPQPKGTTYLQLSRLHNTDPFGFSQLDLSRPEVANQVTPDELGEVMGWQKSDKDNWAKQYMPDVDRVTKAIQPSAMTVVNPRNDTERKRVADLLDVFVLKEVEDIRAHGGQVDDKAILAIRDRAMSPGDDGKPFFMTHQGELWRDHRQDYATVRNTIVGLHPKASLTETRAMVEHVMDKDAKGQVAVSYNDIPAGDRTALEADFNRRHPGKKASRDDVEHLYMDYLFQRDPRR